MSRLSACCFMVSTRPEGLCSSCVKRFPHPPSGKKYDAGNGQDIRPGHQVEVEENSGRIIVSDSNRRSDEEAAGTEE